MSVHGAMNRFDHFGGGRFYAIVESKPMIIGDSERIEIKTSMSCYKKSARSM
ncbi:hypothetical protein [Bartonella senegalensis]|uniref:hypothetical protein n=1 Tax=Bartonella senegalensis TaxID=1468418 RepID=UPI0002F4A811|nr:hypothetical protein [Bartonella senegalensis]